MIEWNEALASDIAKQCDITLTERHWHIIKTLRKLYLIQNRHPATRVFIKSLNEPNAGATMLELMRLFGEKPLRVISQVAGLPPPPHCI